eukprot:CAMPEP_0178421108 /NCGR_PEP_ID=MMETSP0689_2-20121128/26479_1 /TAXON_ID=160604 /ORGANISM="Amphidinium massartii, Strain CS-259" /LENGTH=50 /DNA_ID=CAMNT_0020042613 /DNA_START=903 /DNA_END=1052 /DNA_ORIENTATION=-
MKLHLMRLESDASQQQQEKPTDSSATVQQEDGGGSIRIAWQTTLTSGIRI